MFVPVPSVRKYNDVSGTDMNAQTIFTFPDRVVIIVARVDGNMSVRKMLHPNGYSISGYSSGKLCPEI